MFRSYYGFSFNPDMFRAVQEQILYLYRDRKQPFILAVDEALRQRITVHYNFSGLTDSEVAQYVLHKIACAGGAASIIDQAALSAVHSHSQGNPCLVLDDRCADTWGPNR